jgi:hypothetical protein
LHIIHGSSREKKKINVKYIEVFFFVVVVVVVRNRQVNRKRDKEFHNDEYTQHESNIKRKKKGIRPTRDMHT